MNFYTRSSHRTLGLLVYSMLSASSAFATTFGLTSGNSTVGGSDSNGLVTTWYVDGSQDNVFLTGFYYQIGSNSPSSISVLPLLSKQSTASDIALSYGNSSLTAIIGFGLTGGVAGSGTASLRQSATVQNISGSTLNMDLFLYSDYDISFNPDQNLRNQAVMLSRSTILQTDSILPVSLRTSVSQMPTHYEIVDDFYALYQAFRIPSGAVTLTDTPVIGAVIPASPGDVANAFQWSLSLAPGASFTVASQTDYVTTPEPNSLGTIPLAFLIAIGWKCLRRRTLN